MTVASQLGFFERSADRTRPTLVALPRPMSLRPYQIAAIDSVREKLAAHRSTLLVLPTGTGKTRTACAYVRDQSGPVLWLAHREELIDQARADLEEHTGEFAAKEKAESIALGGRLVVASVQTLKAARLDDFRQRFPSPRLIVVDEAHHAVAPGYRKILDAYPDAKVLGLTATPDRADERAMGQVFDSVAFVYEIQNAIADKWLCPIRINRVMVEAIDLRAVHTVAGDLNQGELDAVMSAEEVLHGVVRPTIDLAGNRRTIVFTTSVENAHRMAEIFNRYAPGSARAIDGGTDIDQRRRILTDHKAGAYQYLCNVGVLTEGYDDPGVACIAMARPTKSRSLYAQCAGRGLRILAGKVDCLLLDFCGNSGNHSLVSALDILGGRYDDDVVTRAREIVERENGALADEALGKAAKEIAAERERAAARRARVQGKVKYQAKAVDPFAVLQMKPIADPYGERYGMTATEPQIAALQNAGITIPEGLTKARASQLIGEIKDRRARNLCSFKQLNRLRKYGIDGIDMSFRRANDIIAAIAGNGWRPLPRERMDALMTRQPGDDLY